MKPLVPRPLEAICLKATRGEPGDRYRSALDVADDVESWLADEPVSAWREPWTVRARRWMRKHRTLVAGAAAALGVGIVTAGIFAVRERQKNLQLQAAYSRVGRYAATARGTTRLLAGFAVARLPFVGADLVQIPEDVPESVAEGLELARTACRKLVDEQPDDHETRRELASICQTVGAVHAERNQRRQARQALDEAAQHLRELRRHDAFDPGSQFVEAKVELASARMVLRAAATALPPQGDDQFASFAEQVRPAAARLDHAEASLRELTGRVPADRGIRFALAAALGMRGYARLYLLQDGQDQFDESLAILNELAAREPGRMEYQKNRDAAQLALGQCHLTLATRAAKDIRPALPGALPTLQQSRLEEALAHSARAQALFHPLLDRRAEYRAFDSMYDEHLQLRGNLLERQAIVFLHRQEARALLQLFEGALPVWDEWARLSAPAAATQKRLNWLRVGLAETARQHAATLNLSLPPDRIEARRLLREGLAAIAEIPADLPSIAQIAELAAEIRKRLAAVPEGGP